MSLLCCLVLGEGDDAALGQEGEEHQLGRHALVLALQLHLLPLQLQHGAG